MECEFCDCCVVWLIKENQYKGATHSKFRGSCRVVRAHFEIIIEKFLVVLT